MPQQVATKQRSVLTSLTGIEIVVACVVCAAVMLMVLIGVRVVISEDERPDPAVQCAEAGGTYIDHGPSLFGPSWACEYPPGSAPG